jgi:coatomer subunit beta'
MGLKLDVKKILSSRSERVKCVDFHPTEPWILVCLYNGQSHIWNYENSALVKTFEVCDLPVRTGKFVAKKNWIILGSDDLQLRVFNYNTKEKVTSFEAHTDYVRQIAIHPSLSLFLTCADDMLIKLWDWDKSFKCVMQFEGHMHYVMHVVFNPKDSNTFASASLDKTVKIWGTSASNCNFTLEGHEKGVNYVDYYHGSDKPLIVSAADDKLIKIWDYQNKSCIRTLDGHYGNVSVVLFHPNLPIIVSGAEDGTVRLWHSSTYRLENTLNYGYERVWSLSVHGGSLGIGCDEGTVVIKLGREDPVISMDVSGKVVYARNIDIFLEHITVNENLTDGERVNAPVKELGNSEVYPQSLVHSPNGRFVVVCGDGEYIIYTALSWRNKCFGSGLDVVWSADSGSYAVRESTSKLKIFKNFKEKTQVKLNVSCDAIFGGVLLGVKSTNFLSFFDWENGDLIRRIDVMASNIFWSPGAFVAICCQDNFFILKFDPGCLDRLETATEEGVEDSFDMVHDISDSVSLGSWIGDCFIYTTTKNRLAYVVGGLVHTVAHFDRPMYLLGYIPKDDRIFVCDKDIFITSYSLPLHVLEYQTAVLRKDNELAKKILPQIPISHRNSLARFLEGLGYLKEAFDMSTDDDQKFELALLIGNLDLIESVAVDMQNKKKPVQRIWERVGRVSLEHWNLEKTISAIENSGDMNGNFLISYVLGDKNRLKNIAERAMNSLRYNLAFLIYFLISDFEKCIQILLKSERYAEAAFFARVYQPSRIDDIVKKWNVGSRNKKASPTEHENLFPNYKSSLGLAHERASSKVSGGKTSQTPSSHLSPTKLSVEPKSFVLSDDLGDRFSSLSMEVNTAGSVSSNTRMRDMTEFSDSVPEGELTGDPELDEILNMP